MRAFHDTRDVAYRSPQGAAAVGAAVAIYLDVWDAPHAQVTLRTWVDGQGEALYEMTAAGSPHGGNVERYAVQLAFDKPCVVWYHFIIADGQGNVQRYGAREGQTGGSGQLYSWEPPSFQLTFCNGDVAKGRGEVPGLCYHVAADGFFQDGAGGYKGLSKKMDYLQDWGVSTILVNTGGHARPASADGEESPQARSLIDNKAFITRLGKEARARGMEVVMDEAADGVSYEQLCHCLAGNWPEVVVNAEAMDVLGDFICGKATARDLVDAVSAWQGNYPAAIVEKTFNLLGRPGQTRLLTRFGDAPDPESLPEDQKARYRLPDNQRGLAKGRLWCAGLIQMLMPGTPAIYYGDEAGVEGFADSAQPAPFPWDAGDADCSAIFHNIIDLRRSLPLLSEGGFSCFAANDDVFGFWRTATDGSAACVLVNASLKNAHDIAIPLVSEEVSEVIAGYAVPVVGADELEEAPANLPAADRYARVHLYQLGSAILYFHPSARLQEKMEPGLGVLAHITSLPADGGPGTLEAPAREFIDWLAQAGVRYWQVLPVNPTDGYGSPYAGISAFAGNMQLVESGDIGKGDIAEIEGSDEYRAFAQREADWLEPYAAFMAIRDKVGAKKVWQAWPREYRRFDADAIAADDELSDNARKWRVGQFLFQRQWEDVRAYANERGVRIIGDMPLYVSPDSADVWANPELFQLAANGRPRMVAGCPPDAFAANGQIWGNPVYNWDAMRESGYRWWLRRLQRAFELYDVVRLDHFIGFMRYFSIPLGKPATMGTYRPGPGIGFFQEAFRVLGPLPVVAEDLGMITPAVRALVAGCGFPGMDIIQFVDGNDPLSGYRPRPDKIAYSGTHDNQTLRGYVTSRYPERDAGNATNELLEKVASCDAPVAVLALQDILGLDDSARMNVPGEAEGNWTWQAEKDEVAASLETVRALVAMRREHS